jgi:SAM-dependent methyltransferase
MSAFDPKVYWETRLSANPGIRGVGYTSLGESYNRWLYRIRRRVFFREVRNIPIDWATSAVLDVGSGTGFYIQLWEKLGVASVTGADLTRVAVEGLRQRFTGHNFFELDIGDPLAGKGLEPFDVVSAFDMLFHIVDDERYRTAISNIHSLLRPGGWFIFSDVLLRSGGKRVDHMVCRSRDETYSVLRRTGFEIVRRRPVFVLMHPVDSRGEVQKFAWRAVTYPIRKCRWLTEPLGGALGATLYPLESLLTSVVHEGPSTEMIICRKPLNSHE